MNISVYPFTPVFIARGRAHSAWATVGLASRRRVVSVSFPRRPIHGDCVAVVYVLGLIFIVLTSLKRGKIGSRLLNKPKITRHLTCWYNSTEQAGYRQCQFEQLTSMTICWQSPCDFSVSFTASSFPYCCFMFRLSHTWYFRTHLIQQKETVCGKEQNWAQTIFSAY